MSIKRLTKQQAFIIMVMSGEQTMTGKDFIAKCEKLLGRVVSKTEFTTPDFINELKERCAPEWATMLDLMEDSGLLVFQ